MLKELLSREGIAALVFGVAFGVAYYNYYVKPADAAKYNIISCMGDDRSRAAYEACVHNTSE